MGRIKQGFFGVGVSQGSILGTKHFLLYIKDTIKAYVLLTSLVVLEYSSE